MNFWELDNLYQFVGFCYWINKLNVNYVNLKQNNIYNSRLSEPYFLNVQKRSENKVSERLE